MGGRGAGRHSDQGEALIGSMISLQKRIYYKIQRRSDRNTHVSPHNQKHENVFQLKHLQLQMFVISDCRSDDKSLKVNDTV